MNHDGIADRETGRRQPGVGVRADGIDPAGDLVSEGQRELDPRLRSVDDMQVGVADAASGDTDPDLRARWLGERDILDPEWTAGRVEAHGAHRSGAYWAAEASSVAAGIGSERARMAASTSVSGSTGSRTART